MILDNLPFTAFSEILIWINTFANETFSALLDFTKKNLHNIATSSYEGDKPQPYVYKGVILLQYGGGTPVPNKKSHQKTIITKKLVHEEKIICLSLKCKININFSFHFRESQRSRQL